MAVGITEKNGPISPPLLGPDEPGPFSILNEGGKARCLLICEHASNIVPEKLDNLGLSGDELQGHIAWDIGAGHVARLLSQMLDAPLILANYSRLVVDLNRRLDHPTAFVTNSLGKTIPGNAGMSSEERALREKELYVPFHHQIDLMLKGFQSRDIAPAVISIHSFTRAFYNQTRPWDIGILWVQDARLPVPVMDYFRNKGFTVGDNEPYDAKILRGTTINHHADARGLPNALVEIRNDLIDSDEKGEEWAGMLADCFGKALKDESLYSYYDGPQAHHDPAREHTYFDELIEQAKRGDKANG